MWNPTLCLHLPTPAYTCLHQKTVGVIKINQFSRDTGLSTRKIVDILYYKFDYIILPRKLLSVLKGNVIPDEKLEAYLDEIRTLDSK